MSKELEALEKLYPKTTYMPYYTRGEKRAFCKIIEKSLKALEIIKELIYIDDNNQVRFLPKDKTITAKIILQQDIADLLKEVLL